MFFNGTNHLPGKELKNFTIERATTGVTPNGRVSRGGREPIGSLRAILAQARPTERDQWRQVSHPVTHKIIQRGIPDFVLKPGDVFVHGHREFILAAAPYNIGELNHWTTYFCEERSDLHGG